MFTTLEALHRAVIASPEDRTVRLAYADALDETGEQANAIRAEFIRTQIGLETVPIALPFHPSRQRCPELFKEHWLGWWRPVCEAAGLPAPYAPSRRLMDRIVRTVRAAAHEDPRPVNWPYTQTSHDTSVHLAQYGMTIRFAAGFPEEVRFHHVETPEDVPTAERPTDPDLIHRWGDAMPLARLAFTHMITPAQWERIDGPHLARLPELIFDQLLPDTTLLVSTSPNLTALTRLRVNPTPTTTEAANADTIGFLVRAHAWPGLRSLHITGRLTPYALRHLATHCTLGHLEELDIILGNPNILAGAIQAIGYVIRHFMQTLAFESTPRERWADYGPTLETFAATPWVRKLRRLRIASDAPSGLLGKLGERLYGSAERGADLIPDESIYALVNALNPDTLERLELPGAIIGPSVREDLMTRLGDRIKFG